MIRIKETTTELSNSHISWLCINKSPLCRLPYIYIYIHCIYNVWINRVSLTMRQSCTCSSSLGIIIVYSVYRDFMTCTLYLWHTFLILKYTSQSHKIPPYKYPGIMFILLNHQNQYFPTMQHQKLYHKKGLHSLKVLGHISFTPPSPQKNEQQTQLFSNQTTIISKKISYTLQIHVKFI